TSDADKASDLMDLLPWVVPSLLTVLAAAGYLAAMDVWLGLAMLLGIVVMVIVIRVITPTLSARYDDQQSQAAEAAATATDPVPAHLPPTLALRTAGGPGQRPLLGALLGPGHPGHRAHARRRGGARRAAHPRRDALPRRADRGGGRGPVRDGHAAGPLGRPGV